MGTVASLDIRGGCDRRRAIDAAIALAARRRRPLQHLPRRQRDLPARAAATLRLADASADVRAVLERCERAARARPAGIFDARAGGRARSFGAGQGLGGAARGRLLVGRRADRLLPERRRRRVARGDAVPRARLDGRRSSTRTTAPRSPRGCRARRPVDRDVRCVRARRAHRRPAHRRRPRARALRDGHRPRSRHRRRLQHRRVRDGRRRARSGRSASTATRR